VARKINSRESKKIHPGSSAADAKSLGGKGDFGVPESNVAERTYTSRNTKQADPGGAAPRSGSDGSRTSGVGGHQSGVGSSSAGDIDTDVVDGIGMAISGKIREAAGPDDSTGTSRDFASGPPAMRVGPTPARPAIHGSTVQSPDDRTVGPQGADATSNRVREDDSFAGEVSSDEASGANDAG
jgi:hypothetical protein